MKKGALQLLLFGVLLTLLPVLLHAQVDTTRVPGQIGSVTPAKVMEWFDSFAGFIMFGVGLVVTRWPKLARIPNEVIPWVNAVGYIVAKLAVGTAHAGFFGAVGHTATAAGTIAYGAFMSALVSLLYDKFAKAPVDHLWPEPAH